MIRKNTTLGLVWLVAMLGMAQAADGAASRLWGRLETGPWRAGFLADTVTVGGRTPFAVGLWYPASRDGGQPMTYRDYVASPAYGGTDPAARIADFSRRLSTWSGWTPTGVGRLFPRGLPPAQLDELLAAATAASLRAPSAPGQFPAVVLSTGAVTSNPILGEYLATHGFLVITYNDVGDRGEALVVDRATHRREDLLAVVQYVRARAAFGDRVTLFGSGSGTVVSLDVAARGGLVDALILQGGAIPALSAELASAIRQPMLTIALTDRPAGWYEKWAAAWKTFRRSSRLTLQLQGSHAELIAAGRLAFPERATDQHLFDVVAVAVRAFATRADAQSVRAGVAPSAARAGGFTLTAVPACTAGFDGC